jgi:hypothetical protein
MHLMLSIDQPIFDRIHTESPRRLLIEVVGKFRSMQLVEVNCWSSGISFVYMI